MKIFFQSFLITMVLSLSACVTNNEGMSSSEPSMQTSLPLSQSAQQIKQQGGSLVTRVPSDLAFVKHTSRLTPQMQSTLKRIVQTLHQHPDLRVRVEVYTDNYGTPKKNQLVSLRRAMVVADYFRNHGVKSARISMAGKGQANPISSNATEAGRMQNRRVEIRLW